MEFENVLLQAMETDKNATSLGKKTVATERASKLKSLLSSNDFSFDYTGKVVDVESGHAIGLFIPKTSLVLTVQVGPATLTNKTVSIGTNLPPGAITVDSPLYEKVMWLKKGQIVSISGRFLVSANMEPLETTFSHDSSLNNPSFAVVFTSVN
jgi:hypothetical protein